MKPSEHELMSKRRREYFRCTRRSELLTIVETNPKYMLNRAWCSVHCRHTEYTRSCEALQLMLRKYFQYPSRCPLHNRIFAHIHPISKSMRFLLASLRTDLPGTLTKVTLRRISSYARRSCGHTTTFNWPMKQRVHPERNISHFCISMF